MSTKTSFSGSQPHKTTRQEWLHAQNSRLPGDGVSSSSAGNSKSIDPRCAKNMHPGGGYWLEDVACEIDNFICDPYEVQTRELEHPTSAYKTHRRKERCHRKNFVYRQRNLGENLKETRNKIHSCQQKHYSYGICRKALKFFAKSIGYRNFGAHSSIREISDYIIKSKLVYKSCKCLQGSKLLQFQIINSN